MKGPYRPAGLVLLGLGVTLLPAHPVSAAGFSYKEVARLGMATPGGNKLVNDFEPGAVSDAGDVAFVADDDVAGNSGLSSFESRFPIRTSERPCAELIAR